MKNSKKDELKKKRNINIRINWEIYININKNSTSIGMDTAKEWIMIGLKSIQGRFCRAKPT